MSLPESNNSILCQCQRPLLLLLVHITICRYTYLVLIPTILYHEDIGYYAVHKHDDGWVMCQKAALWRGFLQSDKWGSMCA